MVKYKELDNLQRSVVDIGVLLKSVFELALNGISNPNISSISVKHEDNLIKVSHTDEYGHVLEFGIVKVFNPGSSPYLKVNYFHSYYIENPTNVLSVRLEEFHSLGCEVSFNLAKVVFRKIYGESPVLMNYVLSSVKDFYDSSLGGVSSLGNARQTYASMYALQSKNSSFGW
jgi:hypothetical protein